MTLRLEARPSGLLVPVQDLNLRDVPPRDLIVGDDLQVTLANLMAFDGSQARLLRADPSQNLKVNLPGQLSKGPEILAEQQPIPAYPVLLADDFEGIFNWGPAGGGTCVVIATTAHRGTKCMSITTTAGAGNQSQGVWNGPYHRDRFRFSTWFYFATANTDNITFQVSRVDGAVYVDMILQYNVQTGVWSYKSSDAPLTFTPFFTLKLLQLVWHYIEFEGSFETRRFSYARIGGFQVPLSNLGTIGASPTLASSQVVVTVTNNAAVAVAVNVDDALLLGLDIQ